jgi:hypothetical protein
MVLSMLSRAGQPPVKRCRAAAACALAACVALFCAAPAAAENPSKTCGPDDIYIRITEWRGEIVIRALPIATHGGCASSWATGQMSIAAVVGQCKRLEEGVVLGGEPFVLTYPHTFYGIWEARNRAGCVKILHGLATGRLDADVLPFPV